MKSRAILVWGAVTLSSMAAGAGCGEDATGNESAGAGGSLPASGGSASGGAIGAGGAAGAMATGGAVAAGGLLGMGGTAVGGASAGGALAAGGASATGGAPASGGAGGAMATGGFGGDPGVDAGSGTGGSSGSAFPPVPYGTVEGPFTVVTVTGTGPGNGYNVYHPAELGQDGLKHPVLTWGNGAATTPSSYPLLPDLASHGFVVIAATSSFVNGAALLDGLEWMLEQNETPGTFEGHLDAERVGAFGYSLGSLATFSIGTEPLLKTTVHISGGIMSSGDQGQATALTNPTAYFCDRNETAANCDTDFAVVGTAPTFYGTVAGVHVDYVFNAAFIERFNSAVIAWMRWQLMGDDSMAGVFEGDDCTLCMDSNWAVQKKNMP